MIVADRTKEHYIPPSYVTNIVNVAPAPDLMLWTAREVAKNMERHPGMSANQAVAIFEKKRLSVMNRGKEVHKEVTGTAPRFKAVDPAFLTAEEKRIQAENYRKATSGWKKDYSIVRTNVEFPVASVRHNYVGRIDTVAWDEKGQLYLVDIKTGSIRREHTLQMVAYKYAYEEQEGQKVDRTALLKLNPDGTYVFYYTNSSSEVFDVFLAMKTIYDWQMRTPEYPTV